uniref:Uncharacterized protein n=1 Tax=Lepeophtheirus salmonis TaxID=72036 RepID=A0A0K2TLK9_LEPSM
MLRTLKVKRRRTKSLTNDLYLKILKKSKKFWKFLSCLILFRS